MACVYCNRDGEHDLGCISVKRKVRVRMTIEYEIEVPASWGKEAIEFHRNDSSFCAGNAIEELELLNDGCLCGLAKFEVVGSAGS